MVFPLATCFEFFHTSFHQTLEHIGLFCHNLEESVMPLQNVYVQEPERWKRSFAGRADISMQRVVVMLIGLQCIKELRTVCHLARELGNPGPCLHFSNTGQYILEVQMAMYISVLHTENGNKLY